MADTFGGRVRSMRRSRGMSQGTLARLVGIRQPSLSDIENGVTKPSNVRAPTMAGLARALETNPGYLVSGRDTPVEPLIPTLEESELIAIYRELRKHGKGEDFIAAGRGILDRATTLPTRAQPFKAVKA